MRFSVSSAGTDMRRARAGFAWVSMMDLLFGLFGALVILTVLIVLKLGRDSGIEGKNFHLITLDAEAVLDIAPLHRALGRMAFGFRVMDANSIPCDFGASFTPADCNSTLLRPEEPAPSEDAVPQQAMFRTGVVPVQGAPGDHILSSALFVPDGPRITVAPFLSNIAVLHELPQGVLKADLRLRVNIKTGDVFWSPAPFCVSVGELIELSEADDRGLAKLDFCTLSACPTRTQADAAARPTAPRTCSLNLERQGGALVLE
ncbi:hypothetical protein SAMN06265368_0966 [Cohaesibacter gelatinilyticus]|uniref:Uncharacterized protein n=2 Tax=Cohaesibacter gelatinilyticus TaxID=372072 RepID=A0A285ND44_9HYPH|nr:hypothetical protein SAMN06265368_0966 [Cohaesibacter gelatinilyticus]